MTILEAQNELIKWFSENDTFILEKNFRNVIISLQNTEIDKSILKSALDKLILLDVITKVDNINNIYVLNKRLSQFSQNIEIQGNTAIAISDIINKYCEILQQEKEVCNSINILESDIINLINIIILLEKGINSSILENNE